MLFRSKEGTLFLIRAFSKKETEDNFFIDPFGLKISLFSKQDLIKLFPNFKVIKENESKIFVKKLKKEVVFIELLMVKK